MQIDREWQETNLYVWNEKDSVCANNDGSLIQNESVFACLNTQCHPQVNLGQNERWT